MSVSPSLATGAVTADTSTAGGEIVVAGRSAREALFIQNRSTTDSVYIGPKTTVTTSNGIEVTPGNWISLGDFSGEVYVVVASGKSCDVRYMELY